MCKYKIKYDMVYGINKRIYIISNNVHVSESCYSAFFSFFMGTWPRLPAIEWR